MEDLEHHLNQVVQYSLQKPPEEMLSECLHLLIRISSASGGSILGEEGASLRFLFSDVTELIGKPVPPDSIAGETASRNVIIYTYAPKDRRHYDGIDAELARKTRYLLSIPIPSVHNPRTDASGYGRASGVLQLLFAENVFPNLDVSGGAVEVNMADIREHEFYRKSLQEVFVILSSISLGMEIMKLRQTSYQAIHELKNKLISAQSWINCLKEDLELAAPEAVEQEDIQEDIHLAQDAVTSGANLAVSYLQFTKIYNPQFVDAQLNDVLRDAASDIQAFADSAGGEGKVRVRTELDPAVPTRQIDPAHLKMAFFNLGKNATEALLEHGIPEPQVTLRSTWDGHITVEVSDNGNGMPPEIADNLFVAFKTKKTGGTGLGLTITKKIVDIHRGMIRCDTGPTGTRFTIQF